MAGRRVKIRNHHPRPPLPPPPSPTSTTSHFDLFPPRSLTHAKRNETQQFRAPGQPNDETANRRLPPSLLLRTGDLRDCAVHMSVLPPTELPQFRRRRRRRRRRTERLYQQRWFLRRRERQGNLARQGMFSPQPGVYAVPV